MTNAIKTGPFISYYGICMYDPSYEYMARLDRMLSLISKAKFARSKLDEFTDPTEPTTSKETQHSNSADIDGDELLRKNLAENNTVSVLSICISITLHTSYS